MTFDLRERGNPRTPFLVILNDRIIRNVVAFDTKAGTVERLYSGTPVLFVDLIPNGRDTYGNFRGLATVTEHGSVEVWGKVESQDDLDAQAGRWL